MRFGSALEMRYDVYLYMDIDEEELDCLYKMFSLPHIY
jgi:hypothetical protein